MIQFSYNQVDKDRLPISESALLTWLESMIVHYQKAVERIDYIFCTDQYVYELNRRHLDHDYYTDILTFPYSYDPVVAEIYISLDRVEDNARTNDDTFENEILRILAHGLLHMSGYNDKTDDEKRAMTREEDLCISKFKLTEDHGI